MATTRSILRILLALAFILAGINHFRIPELYLSMIPPWLPHPALLNTISGFAEIAGGVGILFPPTRRAAATGLILLLIAVFPANIHIAMNGWPQANVPQWVLIARLPLQLAFIAWVIFACPEVVPYRYSKHREPPAGKRGAEC